MIGMAVPFAERTDGPYETGVISIVVVLVAVAFAVIVTVVVTAVVTVVVTVVTAIGVIVVVVVVVVASRTGIVFVVGLVPHHGKHNVLHLGAFSCSYQAQNEAATFAASSFAGLPVSQDDRIVGTSIGKP